jgi:hypothetical protein
MPLQDSDNLIIGRGTDSYKISYEDLKDDLNVVSGMINQPAILSPSDGAGSGLTREIETDTIVDVVVGSPTAARLTFASNKDLSSLTAGNTVKMGPDDAVPYQPISDSISTINNTDPTAVELTLSGDTDLVYFRPGDTVQQETYTTNKLVIDLGSFGDNFYLESVWVDDKILWDSTAFTDPPKNQTTGEFVTDYIEISGATSNGTSNASYWANGKVGGTPNGKVTDTQWRAYNAAAKATIQWNEDISFKNVTLWVSQGSIDEVPGEVELPDTTVVANFLMPGSIANFVKSEGVPAQAVKIISIDVASSKLVVDGGTWDTDGLAGESVVVCRSPLKAPTGWQIASINTVSNYIDVTYADTPTGSQVWVANDNRSFKNFTVMGPTIVDDALLTADVSLESTQFSTTPNGADILRNIEWRITPDGGDEYISNAGTTNPWNPPGLSLNTWHTVTCVHQGAGLEDSIASAEVRFKTGGTRNLYTYYKERVASLESRLASIEADEINDDATDTALLTLIAGIAARIQALEESN